MLAGVGGDFLEPISEPRGLPPNVSKNIADMLANSDGQFASWLLIDEVIAYNWSDVVGLLDEARNSWLPRVKALGSPITTRLVFWFS